MPDLVPQDGIRRHERLRIARDLHDTVAQSLAGIGFSIDSILADEGIPAASKRELRSIRLQLSEIVSELRDEILAIRDSQESHIESWLRDRLPIPITWQQRAINEHLERSREEIAHLLLELLSNAHRHQGIEGASIEEGEDILAVRFVNPHGYGSPHHTAKMGDVGPRLGRVGILERIAILRVVLNEDDGGFELRWQ